MAERILVIDDEPKITRFIKRGLIYEGYRVEVAYDGPTGLACARDNPPDLVILDWLLPGDLDGLEICRRLRSTSNLAILMLTAKDSVTDRITGLNAGADVYLVKPFSFDELLARIRSLLRRVVPTTRSEVLQFADLKLDTGTQRAIRARRSIDLTVKEFELLELFMRNPRQVLTRDIILDRVWHYDFGGASNILQVYVLGLRRKIEAKGESRLLHTVRSIGHVLWEL